jgi:phosphatidate cytidylyltransferase
MPEVRGSRSYGDLGWRLVSGLMLAALAIGLTWAGALPFAGLVLVGGLVMTWEWGHVVRSTDGVDLVGIVHAATGMIATVLTATGYSVMAVVAVAVGAIMVVLMRLGRSARYSGLGVLYVGLPSIALVWLRIDEPYGFLAVLYLFVTVWAADTGAYIAGRSIGGPRLWPSISPNKTWAGSIGGVLASGLAGALFALALRRMGHAASIHGLTGTGLILGGIALAGDLAESALKRNFGVKDSSRLIPGHGGVLDRLDSLVAVSIAAALIALMTDFNAPARALLLSR